MTMYPTDPPKLDVFDTVEWANLVDVATKATNLRPNWKAREDIEYAMMEGVALALSMYNSPRP